MLVKLALVLQMHKESVECVIIYSGNVVLEQATIWTSPYLLYPSLFVRAHLVLQLSLLNPMKPGVKSRMKM